MSWYTILGIILGSVMAIATVIYVVIKVGDKEKYRKPWEFNKYNVMFIVLGLFGWWWMPWLFYLITFMPCPKMPPNAPEDQPTICVPSNVPAKVELEKSVP